ncbi:MAG: hypothetical protein JWM68_721 [Verrucomicrobiales bacterium]|nr:hypothetical protein [Verrucomicrobiales bacterium]
MKFRACVFLTALFLSVSFVASAEGDKTTATAGWAEVDITPPLGVVMGGRGLTETVGKKLLDPLMAQVLYLKDNKGTGFVLVSFDLVGMPHDVSDRIRTDITHELGVEWNLILLNVSHTHSGPLMIRTVLAAGGPLRQNEVEYQEALVGKILSATRAAAKSMSPVKVEVFEGKSRIAMNRRGKNKQGETAMVPAPNSPIDENLWVLKLTPTDGKAPAVVFSYACHPVIVYGFAGAAISSDFPGVTRKALRGQLGEKVHTQFVQGLAGDVRPRVLAEVDKNHFRVSKPGDEVQAGTELANDVLAALKTKATDLKLNLAAAGDRPLFPRGERPSRKTYEEMQLKGKSKVAEYWLERYDANEGFSKGDPWSVGLIRLADNQWIVHLAGEPCVEWRPKFAQWLKGKKFVPFGYSQESITYLPTEEMLPEGGYEVDDSNHARASSPARFGIGLNDAMRKSVLRQLSFIEAKVK